MSSFKILVSIFFNLSVYEKAVPGAEVSSLGNIFALTGFYGKRIEKLSSSADL